MNRLFRHSAGVLALFAATGLAVAQTPPDADALCTANLKKMGLALQSYTQDFDGHLPPMGSAAAMRTALAPYLAKTGDALCPLTKTPYRPNTALSGRPLPTGAAASSALLLSDATPHPDGSREALYANGRIVHLAAAKPAGKKSAGSKRR